MKSSIDPQRAAKLIRMLSSSNDGEVVTAARMLCKMDIHKVAERIEGGADNSGDEDLIAEIDELRDEVRSLRAELRTATPNKIECVVCKKAFVAGRSDAKTCSSRCRTALHRQRTG